MKALMIEVDRCLVDLQKYWNIEESAAARLRSRAKADIGKVFSDADYPNIALNRPSAMLSS
jgi:hypothetical protein